MLNMEFYDFISGVKHAIIVHEDDTEKEITINKAKIELIEIYKKIIEEKGLMFLISILHNQGKISLMKKIKSNEININELIMSEHYYFTNFDICLLVNKYKIPLILISSTKLQENDKRLITYNYNINNQFYYVIKQNAKKNNIVQTYIQFLTNNEQMKFPYDSFSQKLKDEIKNNKITICY